MKISKGKIVKHKIFIGTVFGLTATIMCSMSVGAKTGLPVENHTEEEIRQYLENSGADFSDPVTYQESPSATNPYASGRLSDETLNSALAMFNQIRYIAGIPYNATLDEEYNNYAQTAALLDAANNQLSHTPARPAGISDDLYEKGTYGALRTNLALNPYTLNKTLVHAWMNDSDIYNIKHLGHRRWIISPTLKKTGFGVVGNYKGQYVQDNCGDPNTINGVAWPAQVMPVEYFSPDYAWSLSMNQQLADINNISVKLVREKDGHTWNFSAANADGEFYVDNGLYPKGGCIIFRPEGITGYTDGDVFTVTINGLSDTIEYKVDFFNLTEVEKVEVKEEKMTIRVGTSVNLPKAIITPSGVEGLTASYAVEDTDIASVDSSTLKIYGKKAGETILNITCGDKSVSIPVYVWSDGTEEVKADLYSWVSKLSVTKLNIRIVDGETNKPIEGVDVSCEVGSRVTDENGLCAYDEREGTYEVTFSKEGYHTFKKKVKFSSGSCKTIPLYQNTGNPKVVEVNGTLGSTEYDLLDEHLMIAADSADNIKKYEKQKKLKIKVIASGCANTYQLIQNGNIVAENATGNFEFTLKLDDKGNYYSEDFESGYEVKARILGEQGLVSKDATINLNVISVDKVEAKNNFITASEKGSFKFGESMEITVPGDIPIIGGTQFHMGIEDNYPLSVEVCEDGTIRIAVNKHGEDSMEEHKKRYQNLKSQAIRRRNARNAFGGGKISAFGAGFVEVGASITGYAEGNLDDIANGNTRIDFGLVVTVNGTAHAREYFIPAYIDVSVSAGLTTEGTGTFVYKNQKMRIENLTVNLKPEIAVTCALGAGVGKYLNVEVQGTIMVNSEFRLPSKYFKATAGGNVQLVGHLYDSEKVLGEITGTHVIYESVNDRPVGSTAIDILNNLSAQEAAYDESGYHVISMDYLNKRAAEDVASVTESVSENSISENSVGDSSVVQEDSMDMNAEMAADDGSEPSASHVLPNGTVLKNIHPNASPKLVHTTAGYYLFYLDGVLGRNAYNQSALFYKKSADGNTWSEAVRMDQMQDETGDYNFEVNVTGDVITVCWLNSDKEYTNEYAQQNPEVSISEVSQHLQVAVAQLNTVDDTITRWEIQREQACMMPNVVVQEETLYVAWMETDLSSGNGVFSTENEYVLCYGKLDSPEEELAINTYSLQKGYYPHSLDIGVVNGTVYAAISADTDGQLGTMEDKEITLVNLSDVADAILGVEPGAGKVVAENATLMNPTFATRWGENGLYWYQNGNLAITTDGTTIKLAYGDDELPGFGQYFVIKDDAENGTNVYWMEIANNEKQNGVICASSDIPLREDSWGPKYVVAETDSVYATGISVDFTDTGLGFAYVKTYNDNNGDLGKDLYVQSIAKPSEKEILGYEVDESKIVPGEGLPVVIRMRDKGNGIHSMNMSSRAVYHETKDYVVAGVGWSQKGAEFDCDLSTVFTIPEDIDTLYKRTIYFPLKGAVLDEDSNFTDENFTGESVDIVLGYPDLYVETDTYLANGDDYVTIAVKNDGLKTTDAKVSLYTDSDYTQKVFDLNIEAVSRKEGKVFDLNLSQLDETCNVFYVRVEDSEEDPEQVEQYTTNNDTMISVAAGRDKEHPKSYTVTFDSKGGSQVAGQTVIRGECIKQPTVPVYNGYTFKGWYIDSDYITPWDFTLDVVLEDITLYAKWERGQNSNVTIPGTKPGTEPGINPGENQSTPVVNVGSNYLKGGNTYQVTHATQTNRTVTFKASYSGITSVTIPNTINISGVNYKVTEIAPSAFKNCKKLKTAKIGKNITTIGDKAFYGCSSLTKITISGGVKKIGKEIFRGCSKLTKVTLSKNIQTIPTGTFRDCVKLKSISIPVNVTKIGDYAFYNCKALEKLTLGKNVKSVGKSAFQNCKKMKKLTLKTTKLTSVGRNALKGVYSKCKVVVPKSKLSKYKKLFENKGQKKTVKITK